MSISALTSLANVREYSVCPDELSCVELYLKVYIKLSSYVNGPITLLSPANTSTGSFLRIALEIVSSNTPVEPLVPILSSLINAETGSTLPIALPPAPYSYEIPYGFNE